MNKKAKSNPWMMIALIAIVGIGIYFYITPGTQRYGPFATITSYNYDTCKPYNLGDNQTNLAINYLDSPIGAGDCNCASLSCTGEATCASNGAGEDCQGSGDRAGQTSQTIARLTSDSTKGNVLEILGRRANACYAKNILVTPGKTYTLSFWFKQEKQGGEGFSSPLYCIWRTGSGDLSSDCEPSKRFPVNDTNWHYYQEPFNVPAGTQSMGLFFYAQGAEGEDFNSVTINRYADIRLVEGEMQCISNDGSTTSSNAIMDFFNKTITQFGDFELKMWMIILAGGIVLFFVFKK